MSATALVPGMIIGGVFISALGAGSTLVLEEKQPTLKSLSRDFIIGSLMMMMVLQLLPESTTSMVQWLLGLVPMSLFNSIQTGGAEQVDSLEVKVGVPKF
jgi:hypothetical protein